MSSHCFALYTPRALSRGINVNDEIDIVDESLLHRISRVLRLSVHDDCIIFDNAFVYESLIERQSRDRITIKILKKYPVQEQQPRITWLLPLLEKTPLESALYHAVVLGANNIVLMKTAKSRASLSPHEYDRLASIAIAAAEQAKQFFIPKINQSISLEQALSAISPEDLNIHFQPTGILMKDALYRHKQCQSLVCISGPAADFTAEEKMMIAQKNFTVVQLTQSILKAEDAVVVGLGVFRTMLRSC
jgi:RsmE family RNA methyltransferase